MNNAVMATMDANEAVASIAYRSSEVIAIYPITPSSPMGEFSDEWASQNKKNLWGNVPSITEMQSEGGAAGAVHGALQAGSLATTFTASQGLLLMIPNMYKIAGELTPFVMHVTARTLATHALSIFGDHSDVMACRQTGFAMLCSASVQEAHDMALISHAATLRSRVPFLHFFDGFRTSHEVAKIQVMDDAILRQLIDESAIKAHRERALTPDAPKLRGTAQNPDAFFQAREACNGFYTACPQAVKDAMAKFAQITGRKYELFQYVGSPDAERIIVIMGSGAETVDQTVQRMQERYGEKLGVLKVRLFRPWSNQDFVKALPKNVRKIAVLDRTKEPGSIGEPLYQDIVTALREARDTGLLAGEPVVVGGRYGLSSKEFTPSMVKAVFDNLKNATPKNHFTIGIMDDVTHTSLDYDPDLNMESDDVVKAVFFGLGADGTVGANKNSIKIIGEETDNFAQGYFVYDSKKSGAITISHLRFGPRPIRSAYLITKANFVASHQFNFLEKYDVLDYAAPGATFLLNSPFGKDEVWDQLPREVQQYIVEKKLKFYVIDAYKVAKDTGMGGRINTIMQTCFFAISGVLPREEAITQIKKAIQKTYGKKGKEIVEKNFAAVDHTLAHLFEVQVPGKVTSSIKMPPIVSDEAPDFVKKVSALMLANKGDLLPVSAFPVDGTWPLATTQWEKRNIATEIPVWDSSICIQCNKCAMVCPHAAIRAKVYPGESLAGAPETFKSNDYKAPDFKGSKFTIQVAPEDCTGCKLCVAVCPAKDKSNPKHKALDMAPQMPLRQPEKENYRFFLNLPEVDRTAVRLDVKGTQFLQPLFEYSGACSGCGETPYVKLLTQLFGDRAIISNATGCSSIYGGNLPTTPYCTNKDGRGPAWANSLFEDNAEFGLGFRLAINSHKEISTALLKGLAPQIGENLVREILESKQDDEASIAAQRKRIEALRLKLKSIQTADARILEQLADYLVRKSVWILGGDGWAYDIGYGGLDHVLASGHDVNVLVLDTEVYSNTGGQQSKSTPMGASAKFAAAGKSMPKKDLGLMAMAYGNVYVARIAFGAKDVQTVKAFTEAESYRGPSLIIAYSHCIAHGYDLGFGLEQQRLAVESGYWPLYRYDPRRAGVDQSPLQIDSNPPKARLAEFVKNETRFRMVERQDPERFRRLLAESDTHAARRLALYQELAKPLSVGNGGNGASKEN
ncbi:MAG TPA: pyruvate:ferredoxin (flavodoxin) oxidoreductase [Tepidisphaeraceae bacterium]|nr:pyruvate:ferredoxin (flavodoxin) oxidoreductase [Tepidisphaeraceae bacterium]